MKTIDHSRRYTTAEAASIIGVSTSTISKCLREACKDSTATIGKYSIPGRFVRWMRQYLLGPHGLGSPKQIGFGVWLDSHRHRRPTVSALSVNSESALVATSTRRPFQSGTTLNEARIQEMIDARVAKEVAKQVKNIIERELTARVAITDGGKIISNARRETRASVIKFCRAYGFQEKTAFTQFHSWFQAEVGAYDVEAFTTAESMLQYLEEIGLLHDFKDRLPGYMIRLHHEWSIGAAQPELNL